MVWIIQEQIEGGWRNVRHPDGQPMWYSTKRAAEAKLAELPNRNYRIRKMVD